MSQLIEGRWTMGQERPYEGGIKWAKKEGPSGASGGGILTDDTDRIQILTPNWIDWLSNHLYDHRGNSRGTFFLNFGMKELFDGAENSMFQGPKILSLPMVMVLGSCEVRMRRF